MTREFKSAFASPARNPKGGFALLVIITLLAFVVVLLLGFAASTRIEIAIAGHTQRTAQARANALLALDLALAQLQRHAGPDQRVTATAAAFNPVVGAVHYTGVWDATTTGPAPLTWLVSGNELAPPGSPPFTPAEPGSALVELIGRNTTGNPEPGPASVLAPLQELSASGLPGAPADQPVVIGRYAWWVGDQGVKASVAVPDRTDEIAYAPFASTELRLRLRQQLPLGAGPVDTAGVPVFEPHGPDNSTLVTGNRILALSQVAFLRTPTGTAVGVERVRANVHSWSPNNAAVLADTLRGGLRRDLSLRPESLGEAFAAWADYPAYMEPPDPAAAAAAAPNPPAPLPNYDADNPLRRRYRITPPAMPDAAGIAPVLTYFHLLFGVRKQNAAAPFTLSLRWAAALWNPYTSAFVPEDLRLEITGLPESLALRNAATGVTEATVSLAELYGEPLRVILPWTHATVAPEPEKKSWLPGRVYNWVFAHDAPFVRGDDHPGRFDSRNLGGFANGLLVSLPGTSSVNGNTPLALRVSQPTTLTVRLVRARDGAILATYTSPEYDEVPTTTPRPAGHNTSQLGFLFRLPESFDMPATPGAWLSSAQPDPRRSDFPGIALRAVPNGPNPAAYENFITISSPERLLDRDITRGLSYNEDVPLFELPRSPLLSVGQLQHFPVAGARPFAIGNPWGSEVRLNGLPANALFDRFFFSGLVPGCAPDLAQRQPLSNPLLAVPRRNADGTPVTLDDLAAAAGARSSALLLQEGTFNANAVDAVAWASVLRGIRFSAPRTFSYLDADPRTGTAADTQRVAVSSAHAHIFRFAQSAQETYKADDDYPQSVFSGTGPVINTHLFRRGLRTLDGGQLMRLATAIADSVRAYQRVNGPFRSLEEFLGPLPGPDFGGRSVMEMAIEEAGINDTIPEFSSQWLTQADLMTALAPVLFARSDTFLLRAYGEAVNPATGATEGRAWCEAVVQRTSGYFDAAADDAAVAPAKLTSPLNALHGRRIKAVSFRWLTRSDI